MLRVLQRVKNQLASKSMAKLYICFPHRDSIWLRSVRPCRGCVDRILILAKINVMASC